MLLQFTKSRIAALRSLVPPDVLFNVAQGISEKMRRET